MNTEEIILTSTDFEEVACLNCNSNQFQLSDKIEWKEQVLQYRYCEKCGLKYMSPRPRQEWYKNYYKNGFWQDLLKRNAFQDKGGTFQITDKKLILKQKIANNKRRANRINRVVGSLVANKKKLRILEIGAGFGQTLALFKQKYKADIFAIEPNEEAREYLESIAIPVVGRYAEDLAHLPGNEKFDVIITSHVLENLSYPLNALSLIKSYLNDDGIYFIDTTNLYYRNDTNPYHMLIFTPETLQNTLARVGFKPVKSFYEDNPDKISAASVKSIDPYLSFACINSTPVDIPLEVNVQNIERKQKMGEQFFKQMQQRELKIHHRFDRRVISKFRRIFNIPVPVILAKEQSVDE